MEGKVPQGNRETRAMEKLGYVLYELPVFFLVMWFGIRLVHIRRYRRNRPIFSDDDRQLLFGPAPASIQSPIFRVRLARAILAATATTYIEFLVLAPFGAAILAGALLLTGAAIVRWMLILQH
jgi:hypothetical protein